MKQIVSISLGSSKRNHRATLEILGEEVVIERIGTDGDRKKAAGLLRELDGKVDALGLGGIDLYLVAGQRRYQIRDAQKLAAVVKKTPILDGSGLKHTLERRVVHFLQEQGLQLQEKKVLMTAAVDRFGMAEALTEAGCRMVYGDFIFALGIPLPLTSLRALRFAARMLLPILSQLPFELLYPTGKKQESIDPRFSGYYEEADLIAGDFILINKYLPSDLKGKIILTNTVTLEDLQNLSQRRIKTLITTTPDFQGRSFGTNVMEALLVAFSGRRPEELTAEDYLYYLEKLEIKPRIINF
ncbi:MAG TPA: quinate 5-dehydrogenase [Firmicutes bacterium]|jgi:hypothetical protein|nr:quinate 5-dehydrogenase [Bacillota bacterium]